MKQMSTMQTEGERTMKSRKIGSVSLSVRSIIACITCASAFLILAPASSASATTSADIGYCQIAVAPHTACPDALEYFVSGVKNLSNHARYPGSGTVRVCQHSYYWNGTSWVTLSRTCANTAVTSGSDLYRNYGNGYWLLLTVGNDSDSTHTINGRLYGI